MSILAPIRKLYIRTTNFTHGYQGDQDKLNSFYRLWSSTYDLSVALDPAFRREMKNMIRETVRPGDRVLDIGCGTGLSTFAAAEVAEQVTGIDPSADMLKKLRARIADKGTENIEVIQGSFPQDLPAGVSFQSIISSFAIVHFKPGQRPAVYAKIFELLEPEGRLGLFSAQGEVASSFETGAELQENLSGAGFQDIEIREVADIYRIIHAKKPA